jgi:maltodextrin utilization protein YvdJ
LSLSLFNFALKCAVRTVHVCQDGLKLKYTRLFFCFVYVDDINMLDVSVHTVKQNTAAQLIASRNVGLEINVAKTNCTLKFVKSMLDKVTA